MTKPRDHGGGLDAAIAEFGGTRATWLDLSTGINPVPYPVPELGGDAWTALPDSGAMTRLLRAARSFWNIPDGAEIVAANGASALIASIPYLRNAGQVIIETPTYNEHAAAFDAAGWSVTNAQAENAVAQVVVHPNNPDGRCVAPDALQDRALTIIDESFCDVMPAASLIERTARPGTIVLKSFGKFWGLAGARLGFAIAHPETLRSKTGATLKDMLGPWAVAGPALEIGARALSDQGWAEETRARLSTDAARLDTLMRDSGANIVGGTDLFRLYEVDSAVDWQRQLARHHVWSRIFPYSDHWLRLGLPAPDRWKQLETAL